MKRSSEPFWWSLFSAGGVMAALFVPGLMIVSALVLPNRRVSPPHEEIYGLVSWWPVRIAIFIVVSLSFFHCAHRIRHILMDIGLRAVPSVLAAACYGGALAGTAAAGYLLTVL